MRRPFIDLINHPAASNGALYVVPDSIRHPGQHSGYRVKHGITRCGKTRIIDPPRLNPVLAIAALLLFTCLLLHPLSCFSKEEKWPGVDESVVEKIAGAHGREARSPFINTDQGDLLLFVFLLAGTVGGFVGGYYWRVIVDQKRVEPREEHKST